MQLVPLNKQRRSALTDPQTHTWTHLFVSQDQHGHNLSLDLGHEDLQRPPILADSRTRTRVSLQPAASSSSRPGAASSFER